MKTILRSSLVAVVALGAAASAAQASPVSITTDRVQVRINEGGTVQIRTSADRPVPFTTAADSQSVWPSVASPYGLTPVPYSGFCYPRLHSSQTQSRQVTPGGDRVYVESYSSTRVCQ
ncbi:MAG: hypothetical protein HC929_15785 [Leptolyngbyaceae cyanobacterium SM2_5_2]|nr:hypothetical protein [Leptolyngbyaceae cyanobacterium SM2_5_2]